MFLKEWFDTYHCTTLEDVNRAKREMVQNIILAGLSRSDFFEHAAFFGGTALRILYDMPRFSEDLDFSLIKPNPDFTLTKYFDFIKAECAMYDLNVSLKIKEKVNPNSIESAFLKDKTIWADLTVIPNNRNGIEPELRIKFEIEKDQKSVVETEQKLLLRPFSFYVSTYTPAYLFAGKMHAVLFRQWKNRIKGRDWYDYEWFIKKGFPLNLVHLEARAKQSGHLQVDAQLGYEEFKKLITDKINGLNIQFAKDDIGRFVFNYSDLNLWSKQYFLDLVEKIKLVQS